MSEIMTLEGVQPITGGSGLQAGLNLLCMKDWSVKEGKKGLQLEVAFENGSYTKLTWVPFKKKFENDPAGKQAGFFVGKLFSYVDILAAYIGQDEAKEIYDSIFATYSTKPFNNTDDESVQEYEGNFVKELFSHFPENFREIPINVIFHYDKGYLNIPFYGDNDFQIQFGLNPKLGKKLNMTNESPVFAQEGNGAETPENQTSENQVPENEIPSGGDLPF